MEFEIAAKQPGKTISEFEQMEVIFFMQFFVPGCRLTLDGLMKTN
jgi:hypothetical protein